MTRRATTPSGNAVDADTQFKVARATIVAPSSPEELRYGVQLLVIASDAGSAGATELRALLEAMGVVSRQSWDRAFDLLVLAAQQGSANAKAQLRLLARLEVAPNSDDRDWTAVRSAIDIDRLLAVGNRIRVSDSPRIRVVEGFATPDECKWLIGRARPRLTRTVVFKKTGKQEFDEGRTNSGTAFQVADMDVVMEVIRARIAAATRVPPALFEPTQVLHYAVGQHFAPHVDFLDPENEAYAIELTDGQRIATFLLYLNDEFEGGETEFPLIDFRYRGHAGDAIFWANLNTEGATDPLTLHAGLPPVSGEKWILSQWIHDRPSGARR